MFGTQDSSSAHVLCGYIEICVQYDLHLPSTLYLHCWCGLISNCEAYFPKCLINSFSKKTFKTYKSNQTWAAAWIQYPFSRGILKHILHLEPGKPSWPGSLVKSKWSPESKWRTQNSLNKVKGYKEVRPLIGTMKQHMPMHMDLWSYIPEGKAKVCTDWTAAIVAFLTFLKKARPT